MGQMSSQCLGVKIVPVSSKKDFVHTASYVLKSLESDNAFRPAFHVFYCL